MSWYKAGTVSLTSGSKVVTGAGTDFIKNVKIGFVFYGPNNIAYEIESITSATVLGLVKVYAGVTASGQAYGIAQTQGIIADLSARVALLLDSLGAGTDSVPEGASNLYFTVARVRATVLTGLSLVAGTAITATDTVLTALGKVQKQITDLVAAVALKAPQASPTFTGPVTMGAAMLIEAEGGAVASAAAMNIWATTGNTIHVTGNVTITSMGAAPQAGAWKKLIFDGTPLLTQGANLNLNAGGANIQIRAGDFAMVYADTTAQLDVFVMRASGQAVNGGPAFSAGANAPTTVAQSVFTKINFQVEEFDTDGCFSASRFTPNVPGYYQINAAVAWLTSGGTTSVIYKNGAVCKSSLFYTGGQAPVNGLVYLNGTTDYVEIYGYMDAVGGANTNAAVSYTFFDAHLARPA